MGLKMNDPSEAADVLHAACRSLMQDLELSPREILEDATSIRGLLECSDWAGDDLEERNALLCSFAFICWRSARLLNLSREAQRWESEYRRVFRTSLFWDLTEVVVPSGQDCEIAAEEELLALGPECVFQAILYLRDQKEAAPVLVAEKAARLYRALQVAKAPVPRDLSSFFLGQAALIAAAASRTASGPPEVLRWLSLADRHFRESVDPGPQLARVMLGRMTLLYAMTRHDLVAAMAPVLDLRFEELEMHEDRVKCRIVWAASLKVAGHFREALGVLEPLQKSREQIRPALYGWALLQMGDLHGICGDHRRGVSELTEAASLLREGRQLTGLADIDGMIACLLRAEGRLVEAVALFRSCQGEYARLGMRSNEAYIRLLIAETYLAMGGLREAETEVRAALPIFEEYAMVPDAIAAVNLLREAIRRQGLDPQTLQEVRDRLRPKD